MAHVSSACRPVPRGWVFSLLALVLVGAAWGLDAAGSAHVRRLNLPPLADGGDIPEALARDRYIARHFRPYMTAAMALHGLAFGVLCWAGRRSRLGVLGGVAALALLASAGWHGLNWLIACLFADSGGSFANSPLFFSESLCLCG